ncbi:MAG: Alkaline phosphatase [Acidimicrobiales bacterium]|nr:Alkaline phosphatase [Acidimicrobiales bacterium]
MRAPFGHRLQRCALGALVVLGLAAGAGAVPVPASAAPAAEGKDRGVLSTRLDRVASSAGTRRAPAAESAAAGVVASGPGSLLRHDDRLLVNVTALDPAAVAAAADLPDTDLVATLPDGLHASLAMPASSLGGLEGIAGLRSAVEVLTPKVHRTATPAAPARPSAPRATCPSGVVSEGDAQLKAALARSTYSVDGAGISVGVLSDSIKANTSAYNADVASGNLPGPGNPCGHTTPVTILSDYSGGGSDEGRAMAQIVHDLAPGAKLLYASAFNGDLDFANQIRALRDAGADIIVDDVGYFNEPVYQDGPIAVAINEVNASGVAYFSAAGNGEYKVGGKSIGSYETQAFRAASCPVSIPNSDCHDFDPGAGVTPYDTITLAGGTSLLVNLGWSQPQGGVTTDYDIVLVDAATGTAVAGGAENSLNTGDAVEIFDFTNPTDSPKAYRVYVARYASPGTPRFKFFFQQGSLTTVQWNTNAGGDAFGPTSFGHSITSGMMATAAVDAADSSQVESFSSRGPATYCWGPTGAGVAAPLSSCRVESLDLSASDGVTTTLPGDSGLNPFYGTSAAAPHAAAVAALMLQRRSCRSAGELYAILKANAHSITGDTSSEGAGLVDALSSVANTGSCVPGAVYVPVTPCRLADTRPGTALDPNAQRGFKVGGTGEAFASQGGTPGGCGVPVGAKAIEASVTAVAPSGDGFFRAWPTGVTPPNATFLNYTAGRNITNTGAIAVAASAATELTVKNFGATAHYVVDVQGYFVNPTEVGSGIGSVYVPITPCRAVDTRSSSGPLAANVQADYQVGGTGSGFAAQGGKAGGCGVPNGARAVEAAVTAVGPTGGGFFRAWPTGITQPNATFLNFSKSRSVTNTGSIALAATGTKDLSVKNFGATADYVIDVQGYFVDPATVGAGIGLRYHAITPCRVVDTRPGSPLVPSAQRSLQVSGEGSAFGQQGGASGGCAIPNGAGAVEASVTAVGPNAGGYFRAWPTGVTPPNATFLNFTSGTSITNTGSIALGGAAKDLTVKNFGATTDYVIDVQGYFSAT